jgi:lysyl-tRNA synthetase class 2
VVATGAAALSLIVGPLLVGTGIGRTTVMEVAIAAILNLGFAFTAIVKGKLWTGFVGIWVPFVAFVGAVRLARPNSPWARARYAKGPRNWRVPRRARRTDAGARASSGTGSTT